MNIITPKEVKEALEQNNKDFILLDVRTPEEYSRGKVDSAINLPVDDVASKVETVIPDKSAKIIVYCLSGNRSEIAIQEMEKLGYQDLTHMKGDFLVWKISRFPIS